MKTLLTALLGCSLLLAGCSSNHKYLKQSQDLSAKYSPSADTLLTQNESITQRAKALSATQAGVSDVLGKLATNKTELTALKDDVDGSPAKIQAAINAGKSDEVKSLLANQKEATSKRLPAANTEVARLDTAVTQLEAKAKADAAAAAAEPKTPPPPPMFNKSLADGYAVTGNVTGIEAQLVGLVGDATKHLDKNTWFNFDRLTFKTGSAELDLDASKIQLTNMSEILKAYPKVKLKVGGYTDNVGKARANLKLSTARAKAVVKALIAMGVKASRLSPEGFGDKHPACPANDNDACRAQNQRVAIRVTAK